MAFNLGAITSYGSGLFGGGDTSSQLEQQGVNTQEIDSQVEKDIQAQQEKIISVDILKDMIQNAPEGVTGEGIMMELENLGYSIEGFTSPKTEQIEDDTLFNNDPMWGFVGGAVSATPGLVLNIAGFGADVAGDVYQKVGNLFGGEITDDKATALGDFFRKQSINTEEKLRDLLGVDDTLSADIGSFAVDFIALMAGPAKKQSLANLYTKYPRIANFAKTNPVKFKGIMNALTGGKFGIKAGIVSRGEFTVADIGIGAGVGFGLPIALGALKLGFGAVKGATDAFTKFIFKKFPGIKPEIVQAVEKDVVLTQRLLTGKITREQLKKELQSKLPDMKIVDDELVKLKNTYASAYKDIIKKGELGEDGILRLASERQSELASQKIATGGGVGAFRTENLIKNSKGLVNTIKGITSRLKIKKVKGEYTGADPEIIRAQQTVDDIYNKIITDPKNITQDQLIRFHQAVKNVGKIGTETTTYRGAIRQFSDAISKYTDDTLKGTGYVEAKQAFKQTVDALEDFNKSLTARGTGEIKENLRNVVRNLEKNPERLKNISKAFGTDKKEFLGYLDDVMRGGEAEAALKQLQGQTNIGTFLNNIYRGGNQVDKLSKEIQQKIKPELEKLLQKEQFAKLKEKIIQKKYGGTDFNIKDLTHGDLLAIGKIHPRLANELEIIQLLETLRTSVGLTGGMKMQDIAKIALFKDPNFMTRQLIKYEKLKLNSTTLVDSIKSKITGGTQLTDEEASFLEEFMTKLIIYGNIEEEVYEGIIE